MQPDNTNIPMSTLVDMLALETEKLSQLLSVKNFNEEYDETKRKIKELTAAIENLKENTGVTSRPAFNDRDLSA